MNLRRSPIFQIGLKKPLFLDCERELILMVGLLLFVTVYANPSIITASIAVMLWFIALNLLRRLAKIDALMSKVFIKQIKYHKFYPARSTPFSTYRNH